MSFPLGVIEDANIDYLLKRHFFYPLDFVTHIATIDTLGAPATFSAGYANTEATMPAFVQLAGTRFQSIQIATTAATLSCTWTPFDMDNRWPVYCRIHWTSNSALANVATFNAFWAGGAVGVLTATPSAVFTTPIRQAAAKAAVVDARAVTAWGSIGALNTGSFAFQTFPATLDEVRFNFSVSSLSNGTIGTDLVWVHKVELAYTPRKTFGDGSGREARYMDQILSVGPQEAGPTVHI